MTTTQIIVVVIVVLLLGLFVIPVINKLQFKRMPFDQQVRILIKQAKKLVYFKNISYGSKGELFFVKNKRRILIFPWELIDGKMLCTKPNPFEKWDYPEEAGALSEDELKQAMTELEKYNSKSAVKLYFKD